MVREVGFEPTQLVKQRIYSPPQLSNSGAPPYQVRLHDISEAQSRNAFSPTANYLLP